MKKLFAMLCIALLPFVACAQADTPADAHGSTVLALAAANARVPQVERVEILEYGLYATTPGESQPDPSLPGGTVKQTDDIRHLETTRGVPARLGIEFGFRFNVVGTPAGATVPIHVIAYYPAPGLDDAEQKKHFTQSSYDRSDIIGAGGYISYLFEHPWELVPGEWTFQLWNDSRMVAEQKFMVVKP